jgi:Glycosyl hydrolases family 18
MSHRETHPDRTRRSQHTTRARRVALAAVAAGTTAIGLAVAMVAPTAQAAPAKSAALAAPAVTAKAIPAHIFAPYFEAYSSDNPATVAQASGAKYLSMAFVQTNKSGSCTVYWDGSTSQPIGSTFASAISTIRAAGGDVIPSFGGYTADTTNTEIADSCTSVSSIASAIENVISKYNLHRIDFDVEQNSLTNSAGIDRRNKALKQVEAWASAAGRSLQVSYTLPTNTNGLDSGGKSVISNAKSNGTRVDVVNIMTFDYYTGTSHEMAQATETAGAGLESYLKSLYPTKTSAQLWAMVGVTEMPGIDDYGKAETFTEADAATVLSWAQSKGINEISMWASERDNGGCPGTAGADTCSGISQPTWYFSKKWDGFTG